MMVIKGAYNSARVFASELEVSAMEQIRELCNQEFTRGSAIRVMPDVHAGAGCTIGTTMTITDKVVPNLVGVDIGCGIETIFLGECKVDPERLDQAIRSHIPAGFDVRRQPHPFSRNMDFDALLCGRHVDLARARLSIGTLGGGNHFIEMGTDGSGKIWLLIHSGSRHLGKQTAEYYQAMAVRECRGAVPKQLAYLSGSTFHDYLHDMQLIQQFASLNRKAIAENLLRILDLEARDRFETVHNYIDRNSMILRKGAVSARKGERLLIPLNMRDGSLICTGKSNPDWNCSAPHGAGRIMSRNQARRTISLDEYRASMEGIYTTSANRSTLDECPQAYKPGEEILRHIGDTVDILDAIRPFYNFKAAE